MEIVTEALTFSIQLAHDALKSAFDVRFDGLRNGNELVMVFYGDLTPAEQAAALSIVDALDPAVLSATRAGNEVTITVTLPRNLAAATEVTLIIDGNPLPAPTALTNNAGQAVIVDEDGGTMTINVQGYPCEELTV